ncbi:ectonucleoside triphosphate diphosphohydrolase 2 isoform X2 [Xenopus laevis]|uniref:Ectonucleoside triphosphate diphosphohydrolase 2 isoform X2 n=1 Tax=Xenopus laevis TaxID=8355 RepID=A0A8J0TPK9_XENLA|nr:ectonucleoside triphosphate diphosphohydrolase 2 isoform X2 [Xenopus laevis]
MTTLGAKQSDAILNPTGISLIATMLHKNLPFKLSYNVAMKRICFVTVYRYDIHQPYAPSQPMRSQAGPLCPHPSVLLVRRAGALAALRGTQKLNMANKFLVVCLPILICLVGLIGILLVSLPARDVGEKTKFKYGVVLDAGSSHTALFVYKWPADKENDTGIVTEHSMCDVQGPGISSYWQDPPKAGKSLEECLNQAVRDIPAERHVMTPIYLGATAGMRLLNWTDQASSDKVLDAVSATIKSYPFNFRGAKILSGQDEGVFGWVTANYLLEKFIKYSWIGQWFQPRKGTLGAMDLGGASTQITFETTDKIENFEDEVNLRLYGQSYRVYTHSFLCYGRDQVLMRIYSKVIKAFSAFFYTVDFMRTVMKLPVNSITDLDTATNTICNSTWDELMAKAPTLQKLLNSYCPTANFVYEIISRGYKFTEDSFPNISFQKKAGDTSIGWALGYMLNLTNMIPAEQPSILKGIEYNSWVGVIFLFLLVILLSLGLLCTFIRFKKAGQSL